MTPAIVLLANSSFALNLYDFHLNGVSAKELAQAYDLPVFLVEERLEATRLALKFQVSIGFATRSCAHKHAGAA